jgi:hypothetical protein
MGEGRAPNLERQAPAIFEHGLVDVGAIALIGLAGVVMASLVDEARAFPSPALWGTLSALTRSWI